MMRSTSFPPGCRTSRRPARSRTLDPYVDKYGYRDELQKIAPTYRDNQMKVNGKIYGFPDDGDVFVLYYRKDIFDDPKSKEEFKAKFGYDLAPPKTWKQFDEIGQFLTDKYWRRSIYGAAFFRQPPYTQFMFQERFRNEGGKFFDADTMKATINSDIGVKVFTDMRDENKFMPPGVEQWGFVENLAAFLAGQTAMTISWPPYGRWAAGYGTDEEALNWVPKSTDRRQGRLCAAAGRSSRACRRLRLVGRLDQQEQGRRLSVHPMAEQRGCRASSG